MRDDTPHQPIVAPSAWVERFAALVPPGATVLDVACGAGRHARLFLSRGHPVGDVRFGGVVVANYQHRPLFAALIAAVAPGGALIYETFADGNERLGKPRNPDHLLRPGELLDAVRGSLRVVAYEALEVTTPRPAVVQRICAVNA